MVEPTSGTVRFDGRDVRSLDPRELRRRVALATALGALLFVRLTAARYLTAAHQLRRYLL